MPLSFRSWHHSRGRALDIIPHSRCASFNPYRLLHGISIPAGPSVSSTLQSARSDGMITPGNLAMTGCTRIPSRRVHCAVTAASDDTNTTQSPSEPAWVTMSAEVLQCLQSAHRDALAAGFTATEPSHMMLACLQHDDCTALRSGLERFGTSMQELRAMMHVGLHIEQQQCSPDTSAVVATYLLSTISKQLVRTSMEYALQQGSDVMQLRHLLHCMASASDIVNIKTTPVAYMAYQLNGLFSMNKVVEKWCHLASTLPDSSCNESFLISHMPATFDGLLQEAIPAANTAADITKLIQAYVELNWVPNARTATSLWDKLLKIDLCYVRANEAQVLLAQLQYVPLPPGFDSKSKDIAHLLDGLMCISSPGRVGRLKYNKWEQQCRWPVLANGLVFAAKLSATYPQCLKEYQVDPNDYRTEMSMLKWICCNIFGISFRCLMELIRQQELNSEATAAEVGKVLHCMFAIQQLRCLATDTSVCAIEALAGIMHGLCHQLKSGSYSITPGVLLTVDKIVTSILQLSQHAKVEPKQVWKMLPAHPATALAALPETTWRQLLQSMAKHVASSDTLSVEEILRSLEQCVGYIWVASAEVHAARWSLLAIQPTSSAIMSIPLAKNWLGQGLPEESTSTDLETATKLTELAMELDLSAAARPLLQSVLQMLKNHNKDLSNISAYLSLLLRVIKLGSLANRSENFGPVRPPEMQPPLNTVARTTTATTEKSVCADDNADVGANASPLNALNLLQLNLHDIHAYIARRVLTEHPPSLAGPSCCWEPVTASKLRSEIVKGLMESDVDQVHVKVIQAFRAGQMDKHQAVAWMCLKTNPMDMSPTQLASSLSVVAIMHCCNSPTQEQLPSPVSALMSRWLGKAYQRLIVKLTDVPSSSANGHWDTHTQLATALTALIALSQQRLDLWDLPVLLLPVEFGGFQKWRWPALLWIISTSWQPHAADYCTPWPDADFEALLNHITTSDDGLSQQLNVLLLLSAAAQFQATSRTVRQHSKLLDQLLFLSTAAALARVCQFSVDGRAMQCKQLKDINDYDLLLMAALLQEVVNAGPPAGLPLSANSKAALQLLLDEMERRVAASDAFDSAALSTDDSLNNAGTSKAVASPLGRQSVIAPDKWSVVANCIKACL